MTASDAVPVFPSREECVLPDMLAARAAATPDRPFALFDEETWSYAQTAPRPGAPRTRSSGSASSMGDYVSVWLPTGPDVLRAWFGANAAGAVYSPLNLAARGALPRSTR